jgi:hypothetical protein
VRTMTAKMIGRPGTRAALDGAGMLLVAASFLGLPVRAPVAAQSSAAVPAAPMAEARAAFMQHDFTATRLLLEEGLAAGLQGRDAAEAHRRLAVLAWRFRGEDNVAREHLEAAVALAAGRSESLSALARLELHLSRPAAANAAAEAALQSAVSSGDSIRAATRLAEAATWRIRTGDLAWPGEPEIHRLEVARRELGLLLPENPGTLDAARLQLLVALLLDDGAAALAAWDAYYVGTEGRGGPLAEARSVLARVLPAWRGPHAAAAQRRSAILALAASAQFDAALLLARDPRVPAELRSDHDPAVADVVAYTEFMRRAETLTDDYYRQTAAGAGDPAAYYAAFIAELELLWPRLHWPDGVPPFITQYRAQAARDELARRFGALVNLGVTAGTLDLHYGHGAIDEERTVEQYGERGAIRFVSLDGLVSNGYQTWAWDGESAHGGWGTRDLIVQVRPAYAGGGPAAWRALHEEPDAVEVGAREAAELERARQERCVYLPALRDRLRWQGLAQIRDSLRDAGFEGTALRNAFLSEFEAATVESSIFAHEGRHVIDHRLGMEDSEELEFRAKLSEVAFARYPRLAVRAILSPSMGDATPHGRANLRVMCEVVEWLTTNPPAVLDPELPVLPQLSRLTDDELRQAFRSIDPLASR